ncbi:complement component C3 [Ciona intestinalis]
MIWFSFSLLGTLLAVATAFDHTVVVPKALRVDAQEKIIVNLHGYTRATISGYLQELPGLQTFFSRSPQRVLTQAECEDPIEMTFTVTGDPQGADGIASFGLTQKVRLTIQVTASNSDFTENIDVLVSKHSGYIYVITDRPIYKPNDTVRISAFLLNQNMGHQTGVDAEITIQTPDGIGLVRESFVGLQSNRLNHEFPINENPIYGTWSIEVKFSSDGYTTSSTTSFKIDKYVLPTFDVSLQLAQSHILTSDPRITGSIYANYSYGEPVNGNVYLSATLQKVPGGPAIKFHQIPPRITRTALFRNGVKPFDISIAKLVGILQPGETLAQMSDQGAVVSIFATVNGEADGVMESAVISNIPILRTPYRIDKSRALKYHTPGISYLLQVDVQDVVTHQNMANIPVRIEITGPNGQRVIRNSIANQNGQVNYPHNFDTTGTQFIKVTTAKPNLGAANQATVNITVEPYNSPTQRFLTVTPNPHTVDVGREVHITLAFNQPTPAEIRFYVVSRGSVVLVGRIRPPANSHNIVQIIQVTQAMVPSMRVIAYFLHGAEVVSNSAFVDVVNRCETELTVTTNRDTVKPGAPITYTIEGAPNADVLLYGVDRAAYFLYNGSRLTRNSMFSDMAAYDQGCVSNGGSDGPNVFFGAGLTLTTPTHKPGALDTLDCTAAAPSRKKRQIQVEQELSIEAKLHKCGEDGKKKSTSEYDTCEMRRDRASYTFDDAIPGCSERFYAECIVLARLNSGTRRQKVQGRSIGVNGAVERSVASAVRKDFAESLIFRSLNIGAGGRRQITAKARDSITTYEIDAMASADTPDGFCIAPTTNVKVFKNVFVQVYTPYSLKKREQALIKLSVFNYGDTLVSVNIMMRAHPVLCTHFRTDGSYDLVQMISVGSNSAGSASFAVLPLRIPAGDIPKATVEVYITDNRNRTYDSVKKEILIEDEGELKDIYETFPIDLTNSRVQQTQINFTFPEQFVLGTRKCMLYAYMDFMGPAIEVDPVTQEANNVNSLIRQPYGCGEQTMIYAGPTVFALQYLVTTGTITANSPEYNSAVNKIEAAFQREMTYRTTHTNPRVWSVFTSYLPSTWLNAFVDKVFYHGRQYDTDMNVGPICNSLNFLIGEQMAEGHFRERRPPLHREMHGAVKGAMTLTAYVAISMGEIDSICLPDLNQRVIASRVSAMNYLEQHKNSATFQRPYPLSLLAYAAALHNPQSQLAREMNARLMAMKQTSGNGAYVFWRAKTLAEISGTNAHAYWYRTRPLALDIETTSYALLAQVAMSRVKDPLVQADLDLGRKISLWLISQRNSNGGFRSTQDTVIGLQALSTYLSWISTVEPGIADPRIDFEMEGAAGSAWAPPNAYTNHIDNTNQRLKKQMAVPKNVIEGTIVDVTSRGTGQGILSYRCTYRTVVEEESCHYNLSTTVRVMNPGAQGPKRIKITITVSKPLGPQSEASILDVGFMSGYNAVEQTLEDLSIDVVADGVVDRYEVTNHNVLFYLNRITSQSLIISFEMREMVRVRKPQPGKINIYEYYEPVVHCGQFYSLPDTAPDLQTSNCETGANNDDNLCRCAEGGCPTCRTRNDTLLKTSCVGVEVGAACGTCTQNRCYNHREKGCAAKYVYKVRIIGVVEDSVFVNFDAVIEDVYRSGSDNVRNGTVRTFVIRNDCHASCRDTDEDSRLLRNNRPAKDTRLFREGMVLLITGSLIERRQDRNGLPQTVYQVDEQTTAERMVTDSACARAKRVLVTCVGNLPPKKQRKCSKNRELNAVCENMKRLKESLNDIGCD